ncbi:hypothetical protein AYJ01_04420 [Shewanella algae]|uniref:hypothetical protein n=1 Tax=Shewanella algae TaxID=38313 RepID=UPI001642D45B|nr:hypothetical protein [Shewanella algae]TVK95979.1 hypothetical protein AYJ01_04420 [Shewanella algae]
MVMSQPGIEVIDIQLGRQAGILAKDTEDISHIRLFLAFNQFLAALEGILNILARMLFQQLADLFHAVGIGAAFTNQEKVVDEFLRKAVTVFNSIKVVGEGFYKLGHNINNLL